MQRAMPDTHLPCPKAFLTPSLLQCPCLPSTPLQNQPSKARHKHQLSQGEAGLRIHPSQSAGSNTPPPYAGQPYTNQYQQQQALQQHQLQQQQYQQQQQPQGKMQTAYPMPTRPTTPPTIAQASRTTSNLIINTTNCGTICPIPSVQYLGPLAPIQSSVCGVLLKVAFFSPC